MSTKIYDAYKAAIEIKKVLSILIDNSPKIRKKCMLMYLEQVYRHAVFAFDRGDSKDFAELKDLYFSKLSNGTHNYGLSVVLFPIEDITYLLFFGKTSMVQYIDIRLTDFHYQDSTDRPLSISAEDWDNRIAVWDNLLGGNGYGRPIDYGLQYTIADRQPATYYDLYTYTDIEIPTDLERAQNNAIRYAEMHNMIRPNAIYTDLQIFKKSKKYKELIDYEIKHLKTIA